MTLNALEAFRLASGKLFVYGDSCKVYGNCNVPYLEAMPAQPISAYAIAKSAGWQLCDLYSRVHNLCAVSIRPTMIYGPRQSFNLISFVVDCVLDGKREVVLDGGSQTRDPLYVDDAVAAFVSTACLGSTLSRRIVNIGGGNEQSVLQLAELVLELMDADLRVVEAPSRTRPTETKRSYCDNRESRTMLDWQPRVSLREGLSRTIEYLVQSRGLSLQQRSRATSASAT
jgi:nucleoside-diphosphate-sugar epimerase